MRAGAQAGKVTIAEFKVRLSVRSANLHSRSVSEVPPRRQALGIGGKNDPKYL